MSSPVFHITPMGRLGNLMIQYMVALTFSNMLRDCRISNISMPVWGIHHDRIESPGPMFFEGREQHIDLPGLAEQLRSGELRRVEWQGFGQRMENFLPRDRYASVFRSPFDRPMGYGPGYLVCPVRAEDIVAENLVYPLTPVEFYRDIVRQTGLQPVFIGQTHPNIYMVRIHAAFPGAEIRPPQDDVLVDFETIRQSRHLAIGVSTYSWLAAWLSESAETIHLTVSGLFHPLHKRACMLLPFGDPRYLFHLFPINSGVPLAQHAMYHQRLAPYWRLMSHDALSQLLADAPRFPRDLSASLAVLDQAWYLATNEDVARIAEASGAGLGYARTHYKNHGFHEERDPLQFDPVWYTREYPMAAVEVSQGDYASLLDHYAAVGAARGYLPHAAAHRSV